VSVLRIVRSVGWLKRDLTGPQQQVQPYEYLDRRLIIQMNGLVVRINYLWHGSSGPGHDDVTTYLLQDQLVGGWSLPFTLRSRQGD
jgi:hypothetical protein